MPLRAHLLPFLLLLCLPLPLRAQTQDAAVTLDAGSIGVDAGNNGRFTGGRLLSLPVRYHAGDDPAWAEPGFDDRDWELTGMSLSPDHPPRQGWPGIGWFRLRLRVDPSLRQRELGFALEHVGAVEVYLDGRRVYKRGTVGTTEDEEVPFRDLDPFTLPLDVGIEHVLALRYSSHVTLGFPARWHDPGLHFYWGDRATMTGYRNLARFNQGAFSAYFLAFALLFALLFGLYPNERIFLYVAVFYALVVPFAFIRPQILFLHAPALVMPLRYLVVVSTVGLLLAALRVLYAFFYPTLPRLFYVFLIAGLLTTTAYFVNRENQTYVLVFLLLLTLESPRVLAIALWRRKRWAWVLALGYLPPIVLGAWSAFEDLGWLTTPWSGSAVDVNLLALASIAVALAAFIAIQFAGVNKGLARANRELAEINRSLEDRVAHRTEALEQSLAHLKATQARLVQHEKMASLGQLTAGIAHEIKNPLNFINNFATLSVDLVDEIFEELADDPDLPVAAMQGLLDDLRFNAGKINAHGQRADSIVRSMMQHAQRSAGRQEPVDLNALVEEYTNLAYLGKRARDPDFDATIEQNLDPNVGRVSVIRQEIGRVLLNLLGNAFDAVQGHDAPTVTVSTLRVEDTIEIWISDNGPGIPAEIRDRIFEPFFTTKPTGSGTGLGLSLSFDIVTGGHGGTLEVDSSEGAGATFVVTLPLGSAGS